MNAASFNWKNLCSNESGFNVLHNELRNCGGKYILDNVKMPDTCEDRICTIEFKFYSENKIELTCIEAPITYTGSNNIISEWLTSGSMEFSSFNELKSFLSSFKYDTVNGADVLTDPQPHTPVDPSPASPTRPKMRYDKDALIIPDSNKKYLVLDKDRLILDLNDEIFGQEENIAKIAHLVCNHLATKHKSRPLSIFLYGTTGIGKTAITENLVTAINKQIDSDKAFSYKVFDCSQVQEHADISRLIGAPPGYVGFDEPGAFAILEDNPNTIFVFDEIEKAANNATEVLMRAMDTGKQETNGKTLKNGETFYDLSNCIIFFTSNVEVNNKKNIGFTAIPERKEENPAVSLSRTNIARLIGAETKDAKIKLAETGKFKREVIGRMNAIIKFNPISGDAVKDIAAKSICNIAEKDHYLYITEIDTSILQEFLNITAGEVENFGVRALRDEAQYYFSDALRTYSHSHDDYAHIHISGTLDDIIITEGN